MPSEHRQRSEPIPPLAGVVHRQALSGLKSPHALIGVYVVTVPPERTLPDRCHAPLQYVLPR
jgi:hypothetical protein